MSARDANTFLRVYKAPGNVENYFCSRIEGEEFLSKPYLFTLTIRSQGEIPPVADWMGAPIVFGMAASDGTLRKMSGQCVRIEQSYQKGGYVEFVIDVGPQFLRAKQRRDCQIFKNIPVKEIIEKILQDYKLQFDATEINHCDDEREYCVQYWETDFDFCCRLMEEEGIFYYFRYDPGAGPWEHTMFVADDVRAYFEGEIPQITFREDEHHQGLVKIDLQHMQCTSAWMTHDYNYKKPKSLTPKKTISRVPYAAPKTKFYQWPGKYDNMKLAERYSKFGIELAEAASVIMSGVGTYMCFMPAARFEIIDKRLKPAERKIAIKSVKHSAHNPYSAQEGKFHYTQSFTAVPSYEPYHPPRDTPRAFVQGPQTAVVIDQEDPEGFGRIKVRFHWNHGENTETDTAWLRVAQQWAGAQIGAQWIPRVGMEVLVSFLEGDPDRPVISACLYNGDNKHPFPVPENLHRAGWRTISHPDGEVTNEFVFDDKKDEEEIYTRAGRNYRRETIKDEDIDIGEYLRTHIGKDETRDIEGEFKTTIGKDQTTQVGGKSETIVAQNAHLSVGGGLWVEVKDDIRIDSTSGTHMVTTADFTLESKTMLVFQVGGSRIEMTAGGIVITAPLVKIN